MPPPEPVVTDTTYEISYNPTKMTKYQSWSDNTVYNVEISGTESITNTLTNVQKTQYTYYDGSMISIDNNNVFPYIISSVTTTVSSTTQTTVQTWSDNTSYTQIIEQRLMINGTKKLIITNDGVVNATLSNTSYALTYNVNYVAVLRKTESYSDDTQYTVIIQPTSSLNQITESKVSLATRNYLIDGVLFSETFNGVSNTRFPYITSSSETYSNPMTYYTQTWSNGKTYTRQTQTMINFTGKDIMLDGVVVAYKTTTRYVVTYPSKTAINSTFINAANYYCTKYEDWSDNTTYNIRVTKTQLTNTTSVSGIVIPQFTFNADSGFVTEKDINDVAKTAFPYIVSSTYFFMPDGQTDTWSDGRIYSI